MTKHTEDFNKKRRERHRLEPRIRLRGGAYRRARIKGLKFDLPTYKDLPKCPKKCPVLNIPLRVGKLKGSNGGGTDNSPSLDRIDNNKGYIKGNVQIISRKANQMKSNADFKDIERVYKYMKKQRSQNGDTPKRLTGSNNDNQGNTRKTQ